MLIMFAIFQWLQEEFLPYFDKWQESVTARTGFEDPEKKMMMITQETLHGIKVNGNVCNFLCTYIIVTCLQFRHLLIWSNTYLLFWESLCS